LSEGENKMDEFEQRRFAAIEEKVAKIEARLKKLEKKTPEETPAN
jgi:hypothetical protein